MKTSKLLLALVLGGSGSLLGASLSTHAAQAQGATTGAIQGTVSTRRAAARWPASPS